MEPYSVYDYANYRDYLRAQIDRLRDEKSHNKMTYRAIAKKIGLGSHNFLTLVIQGKRNLSQQSAKKIADLLDLNTEESSFFVALVGFNQAELTEEKMAFQRQMFSNRGFLRAKPIESAQYKYFSHWSLVLLHEMIALPGFSADPEKIVEQIADRTLTAKEVEKALNQLCELRLVDKSVEGKYFRRDSHIELPPGLSQGFIFAYHKTMIEKSLQALFKLGPSQREVHATTLNIDDSKISEAKQFLAQMRTEFISRFSSTAEANATYQFNYQLFEMAKIPKTKK